MIFTRLSVILVPGSAAVAFARPSAAMRPCIYFRSPEPFRSTLNVAIARTRAAFAIAVRFSGSFSKVRIASVNAAQSPGGTRMLAARIHEFGKHPQRSYQRRASRPPSASITASAIPFPVRRRVQTHPTPQGTLELRFAYEQMDTRARDRAPVCKQPVPPGEWPSPQHDEVDSWIVSAQRKLPLVTAVFCGTAAHTQVKRIASRIKTALFLASGHGRPDFYDSFRRVCNLEAVALHSTPYTRLILAATSARSPPGSTPQPPEWRTTARRGRMRSVSCSARLCMVCTIRDRCRRSPGRAYRRTDK